MGQGIADTAAPGRYDGLWVGITARRCFRSGSKLAIGMEWTSSTDKERNALAVTMVDTAKAEHGSEVTLLVKLGKARTVCPLLPQSDMESEEQGQPPTAVYA